MKTDLHLHSRHSARAPEWLFRRVGLPDSYSEPRALYTALRAHGMDLVTLTDHNRIEGCLEIADQPGVFLSEQVSTRFPDDRCEVHVLVWGLTEAQHRDLQGVRENIFELQKYLAAQQLTHAVAHPFYRVDDRLSLAHIEKLTLLFQHFEGLNGHRDALLSSVVREVLGGLTPEKMDELANRHDLAPTHAEPWRKIFTAGSDDHGGMFPASAFTETPDGETVADFLAAIRAGRCTTHGAGGTPLALSHSLYNNLRQFVGDKVSGAKSSSLLGKAFSRFMEGEDPTEFSWTDKLAFVAEGIASGKIFELAKPANASLWKQFAGTFTGGAMKKLLARETEGIAEPERRAFVIANFFVNQLAFRFFTTFIRQLSDGNIIEAIREVSVLLPVLAPLAPYFYAFRSQAPDRRWLAEVGRALNGRVPAPLENRKRAWFTDTLEDVNGVANTIRKLTAACIAEGGDITVVTSRSSITITGIPIKNFAPVGEFELPEYELQKLSFPPILQMIDYIQREGFTELIISTPGPIGVTALLAAKLLGLRTSGIYHTDFPQYVRILTDDNFLETLTWNYMKWFYEQLDLLYVNSEGYRRAWADRGIAADKIRILPRGLDTALFHPSRRDPEFWSKYGIAPGATVLLYVGRVSKEKDLDVIVAAWRRMKGEGRKAKGDGTREKEAADVGHSSPSTSTPQAHSELSPFPLALAFVGDGPFQKELRQLLPDAVFTGYLAGLELARAFASADVFLFPSTTDTFGNVILEALASGVPCLVSDQGGPKDLIVHDTTGYITRALDVADFTTHVEKIARDPARRQAMGVAAHHAAQDRDWAEAGRQFWTLPES
ncbi:MAG: glycosyltransferase [Chthoniobacter sp.]|nr:glycosyltransferase [Chthoniobacter sp.]